MSMEVEKKLKLQKIGGVLALIGLGSIIMSLFDYNLLILAWIDFFGDTFAWIIRIGFIIVGILLYFKYDVDDAELSFKDEEKGES